MSTGSTARHFIVIMEGRSGSTFFVDLVRQHPQVIGRMESLQRFPTHEEQLGMVRRYFSNQRRRQNLTLNLVHRPPHDLTTPHVHHQVQVVERPPYRAPEVRLSRAWAPCGVATVGFHMPSRRTGRAPFVMHPALQVSWRSREIPSSRDGSVSQGYAP